MTAPPIIEAIDVRKSFPTADGRQIEILRGVSLSAAAAQMTAIIGPSGSGKSTALLCLAGLEKVTSGQVVAFGKDLGRCATREISSLYRDRIGFVFQAYNLIPYLTVSENISISSILRCQRVDKDKLRQVLDDLGLAHRSSSSVTTLSGGEQQRAALGRVLYQNPPLIFADEPTGALDTKSAAFVLNELRRLADRGTGVVIVTHDIGAAAKADSVVVMRDGSVTGVHSQATPAQLMQALNGMGGGE